MDKLEKYRNSIKKILTEYQEWVSGSANLDQESCLVFDEIHDQYFWLFMGWEGKKKFRNIQVHIRIKNEKIYIEIVIRPDSIVYLALSIAMNYRNDINKLKKLLTTNFCSIKDWTEGKEVMPYITEMIEVLNNVLLLNCAKQEPLIMQPIWKTIGKSSQLADNCLDIFVWSNLAFTRLFLDIANKELSSENKITRQLRSVIWLLKMLLDFCNTGKINHTKVIDQLSYNTRNDKAFAVSGKVSHPFMTCAELTTPRIRRDEIKKIILGNGHLLLSPERRFDAIIYNSPDLFN
jgi:hypothetical protein